MSFYPLLVFFEMSCSLQYDVSLCFSGFSHYVICVMSIFPQFSDFDFWMIINLSDSDTKLNVSSFTKFSNVLRPFVFFFEILMVLYDSMIFLVSVFLTNLWARLASFPNWVVSICDWLRTHMIQKLNRNIHLMPSFQMFLTDSSLFLDSFFKSNSLSMMSIFPQMSGFDLWMIINLSDSDTDLKVSSYTKFLNVILPFVVVFWSELFLMIRCFSLFQCFFTLRY